jgi:hypothetical protein
MKDKRTQGRRVECDVEGWYKLEPGDYVKTPGGYFMSRVPDSRFHTGSLEGHEVVEHDDGTITVSPSILHTEPNVGQWHGFLVRGVWREC